MEKRKKWDLPHWVTPGVFSGNYVVDEAVERITSFKPMEFTLQKPSGSEKQSDENLTEAVKQVEERLTERIRELEQKLIEVKEQAAAMEKHWKAAEEAQAKERQHLYQVVLSLKKEWENERNAHRDH